MIDRVAVAQWMSDRAALDDRLYQRYGRALEANHGGDFVAISDDGQTILGLDELVVASQGIQKFGPGEFALRRIGADSEIRWRRSG